MEDILTVTFHGKDTTTKNINTRLGWNGIKCIANKLMNTCDWYFQYKDDEGDSILGASCAEWQEVTRISKKHNLFPVEIFPLEHDVATMALPGQQDSNKEYIFIPKSCCRPMGDTDGDIKEDICQKNVSCCEIPSSETEETCCTKSDVNEPTVMKCCKKPTGPICDEEKEPVCDVSSGCCSYQRPLPPDPDFDENEILVKEKNPLLPQQKYTNEALRALTCPLGPIGGGCIAIAGDGGLRQWQISNKVYHNAQVPDSFFAIKVGSSAVVLQSNTWYDQKGFKPSAYITDHYVPVESKALLSQLPGVKTVEVTAKYPIVEVDYLDDKLKDVRVHLEAWSPKIPHDSKNSAIPVILFDFHVTNNGKDPIEVSLLGSLQNIIGWDGYSKITNEVNFAGYGGNTNSLHTTSSLYGINMNNPSITDKEERYGHVELAVLTQSSDKTSAMLQYNKVKDLWTAFTGSDTLPGQEIAGVSPPGTTFNGAISNSRNIDAGQTSVFTYMIFWHFPNRYKDWSTFVSVPNTPLWIGTQYAKFWPTIKNVVEHTVENLKDLGTYTYKFRDNMFNTTLPWQMVDSAAGRVSVLNSPTCMWTHDGYFYAFEGCSNRGGCCPLNCTHVWNYEMTLAYLYPDLERTMREIDLLVQITPHGVIPSRTECPLQIERAWNRWRNYSINPASTQICIDGEIGTILKTYREIKLGASKKWYSIMWEPVKLVMKHWLDVLDTEKNGMVYGPQPNTFDRSTYGYMVIWGLLYLCGLRAAEEMAKLMGDKDFGDVCHTRFSLGAVNLDKACFTNGKWYTHVVDPNHNVQVLTDSTFVGALYGQWWAHLLGLGYLLPRNHIVSHLKYTYTRNYVKNFDPAIQYPRKFCDQRDDGWVLGQWNSVADVPNNALRYSREASWSGVLYPFASLLIMEGLKKEGLNVLEVNRYLYDGTRRSPWNEIECGDHYARPMSSWSLFQTASGQDWTVLDGGAVKLTFKPTINEEDFTGFFVLGTCWGTYSQQLDDNCPSSAKLSISYGTLDLDSLTLHIPCTSLDVTVGTVGTEISAGIIEDHSGAICIKFTTTVHLKDGDVLNIELS